jgi:flagellar biosynthesis protein FliR
MLKSFSVQELFSFATVICRIGGFFAFIPGFSEAFISPRIRILLILGMGVALTPLLHPHLPPLPSSPYVLFSYLGLEIIIGLFLGFLCRFILYTVEAAGAIIALQINLSNVFSAGILMAMQSTVVSTFLSFIALLVIFTTELHGVFFEALVQSYTLFQPGHMDFQVVDFTETFMILVSKSFVMSIKLAAPFLVFALVFNAGLGLMARLVPQIQVFFIVMPLQIALGLGLLTTLLGLMLLSLSDYMRDLLLQLTGKG